MPIISYLVYPETGAKDAVAQAARSIQGCEVLPAENQDLLIVVAESGGRTHADELERRLLALDGCSGLALVAAFETEEDGQ